MDILTVRDLRKSFGDKQVLRGLELTVPERSVFGFVGRNGAGKTTTMKAVLGLLRPDGGEIRVAGERVAFGQTATNRFIGYLPDVPEFYSFMTAREYLRLCGESLRMERNEIETRSRELLELVGLGKETHRIKGYSRGMKQRLGIAQALIGRPKLLICDEPTSALDPIGRREILDVLLSVREQTTVLFSTHILSDVERICTDVALLHDGRIAMQGPVDVLKRARRPEEFAVELMDSADTEQLLNAFGGARRGENGSVILPGSEAEMAAALEFIRGRGLSLRRMERAETSIESLFLEVVQK